MKQRDRWAPDYDAGAGGYRAVFLRVFVCDPCVVPSSGLCARVSVCVRIVGIVFVSVCPVVGIYNTTQNILVTQDAIQFITIQNILVTQVKPATSC